MTERDLIARLADELLAVRSRRGHKALLSPELTGYCRWRKDCTPACSRFTSALAAALTYLGWDDDVVKERLERARRMV
jgi:hypothetical protein